MTNTAYVQTTMGNIYVAIRNQERPDFCHLYCPGSGVSYVPWCKGWEITPIDPESEIAREAIAAIEAERERILLNHCDQELDQAARQGGFRWPSA